MKRIYISLGVAIAFAVIAMIFASLSISFATTVCIVVMSIFIVNTLYEDFSEKRKPVITILILLTSACVFIFGYAGVYALYTGSCSTGSCADSLSDAVYFSIVTATTLGYGDFAPLIETRMIAAFQAVTGYVFLGLVLAGYLKK